MSKPLLAELSELLGVEVTDVRHTRLYRGDRPQPDNNAWLLRITGREWDDWPVPTPRLRTPWSLNTLALRWGRDPSLPPLTSGDGRRLLRLMHEHVEAKTATESTTTTTTKKIQR